MIYLSIRIFKYFYKPQIVIICLQFSLYCNNDSSIVQLNSNILDHNKLNI